MTIFRDLHPRRRRNPGELPELPGKPRGEAVTTERMRPADENTNPVDGAVRWHPAKSLWYSGHLVLALVAVGGFLEAEAVVVCGLLTVVTLCLGHTVGLHRLFIHRNFVTPRWLERILVSLGTLVGMGGPFGMIYLHDIRDWAQRHPACHPFFIHRAPLLRDGWWNLLCRIELRHPPTFRIGEDQAKDPVYRFLQRTWMAQQIPLALALFLLGGWAFVLWGVSVRIVLSLTGHWLIGHFAHNRGDRTWHLRGHAVQGYNLPHLGLLTMGECWHNNHHAWPDSARLGIGPGQVDPGWWFVRFLERVGLATRVRTPETLPERSEREPLREEPVAPFPPDDDTANTRRRRLGTAH